MSASYIARAPRQAAIVVAITGLHVGVLLLAIAGMGPRLELLGPSPPAIVYVPPAPPPLPLAAPSRPEPIDYGLPQLPKPVVAIPDFVEAQESRDDFGAATEPASGSGPGIRTPELHAPALRMRGSRLAALIDACYPGPARRQGEEGRVVIRIDIDAAGRTSAWNIVEGSGFARLDAAVECVIRRLEFVPGRRDGEAVAASAMLPIVFRLD